MKRKWLLVDGRELWRHGVAPDTVVALPVDAAPLIPETERDLTATDLQASKDAQLLKAIDSLTKTSDGIVSALRGGR